MIYSIESEPVPEKKLDLAYCKKQIKTWRKWYMRKNSRYSAAIQLRCYSHSLDPRYWKYYIELWIDGKMKDRTLIMQEAYDTFRYDESLKKEEYQYLEITTLCEFNHNKQQYSHEQKTPLHPPFRPTGIS